MKKLILNAPCKINLFLHLTGKRDDGYNNLITVFYRLALSDTLTFKKSKAPGITITCEHKEVPLGRTNLVAKAYAFLQKKYAFSGGVSVHIDKKIPVKAGLGGASSDAATTLIALNRLFNIGLTTYDLCDVGAQLGADVSFFLTKDRLSLGLGRGDTLLRMPYRPQKLYFVLFIFKDGLKTPEVYRHFRYPSRPRMSLTNIEHTVIMLPLFLESKDLSAISRITYNDLLTPACKLKPQIKRLLKQLKDRGVETAHMTGSGPTVYAVFSTRKEASRLASEFRNCEEYTPLVTSSH